MRIRDTSSGQSLTEFALILPAFFLIVLGLLDAGRAILAFNTVSDAAREGAREAIVNQRETEIDARVMALTTAVGLSTTNDDVDVAYGTDCAPVKIGCVATVSVTAGFAPITPIVGNIIGSITLSASSSMPVEDVEP